MAQSVSIYGVLFNDKGEILLVKDAHSHLWGCPGGGVEDGETHDDALRREFLEETGLRMSGNSRYITQQTDDSKQRFFYRIETTTGALLKAGNASDVEKAAYFSVSHLPLSDSVPGLDEIASMAQVNAWI